MNLEKLVAAKKAEEKAIEDAQKKMLWSTFLESGLKIEEAVELLRGNSCGIRKVLVTNC